MFEEIFFPRTVKTYRNAPLADERARYLSHLADTGHKRSTLRKCANHQLSLVRLLNLKKKETVYKSRVVAAAGVWCKPHGRRCTHEASPKMRQKFISDGVRWLRFLGWLDEPEIACDTQNAKIRKFEEWLRTERCLSAATIDDYRRAADYFVKWLAKRDATLWIVQITDLDQLMAEEHKRGAWNRRTIHDFAQRLKAFLKFAETRGWCRPGLVAGMMAPGFMTEEPIPKGISREDVVRLLNSARGERPTDRRDFAILNLLVAYGLRAGEVAGLQIDDIDWEGGTLRVRSGKSRRSRTWPLSPDTGNAIALYIQQARPVRFGRSLFFTSHAPIRPLCRKAVGNIVHYQLARIGVVSGRRGSHALRHAAAQHLMDQGMSMKVIGDFLGHRDPSSTAIYAKVNIPALREVAALDLEGLI